MRVEIVCEGSTDYEVLRAIVAEVLATHEPTFSLLQPPFDRLERLPHARKPAGGWQAVRSYLRAGRLQAGLAAIDLVVVHVDASIRKLPEIAGALTADELEALCDHVKGWIGDPVPDSVIIALPREELETWLLAANTRVKNVERIDDPVGVLVDKGLLTTERGRPAKRSRDYAELMIAWRGRLGDAKLLRTVPELERLCAKLRALGRRRGRAAARVSSRGR